MTIAYIDDSVGYIDVYSCGQIVATVKGKINQIIITPPQVTPTRWGIVFDTPNNLSFNCIYADAIRRK